MRMACTKLPPCRSPEASPAMINTLLPLVAILNVLLGHNSGCRTHEPLARNQFPVAPPLLLNEFIHPGGNLKGLTSFLPAHHGLGAGAH